ncbi:hypothetical protein FACS1894187_00410 [Synergistales bacterium]|nr:hypothetical protein FACS1894187_00410 [Synergistales bacterium]
MNNLPVVLNAPKISSLKRNVETYPIRTQMKVTGSTLFVAGSLTCSSKGFRLSMHSSNQAVKTKGSKIRKYASGEIKTHTIAKIKITILENTKLAAVVPQERTNRLRWQKARPKTSGEVILAWFGPIIDEAVVKLTLDKRRGTLLIWYNPQSRRFDSKGVFLCRRLGSEKHFEWRWV